MKRLALILLVGCGTTTTGKPYQAIPHQAPPDVTDEQLYTATLRVFQDLGAELRDKDKDTGTVITKYTKAGYGGGLSTDKVLHAWRVVIREGKVRIDIGCVLVDVGSGRETGCVGNERQLEWIERVPVLRDAIFAEAKKLQVGR